MPNENCLEGIACPNCKSEEPFRILAVSPPKWFEVTDEGTESDGDVLWEDHSPIQCVECGHSGTIKDFK